MNLERTSMCVSLTQLNRESFRLLNSIRPNSISFSQYMGIAASDYYDAHKNGVSRITDFTNKDVTVLPNYFAEIDFWKKYINDMPQHAIKKFQTRHQQIGNLINKRVQEIIG